MKNEMKQITLELIKTIESNKEGKIDPPFALFNEIWHNVFMNLKESITELKNEGLIIEYDTINQKGYKIK